VTAVKGHSLDTRILTPIRPEQPTGAAKGGTFLSALVMGTVQFHIGVELSFARILGYSHIARIRETNSHIARIHEIFYLAKSLSWILECLQKIANQFAQVLPKLAK
jgi:hypothetical protein